MLKVRIEGRNLRRQPGMPQGGKMCTVCPVLAFLFSDESADWPSRVAASFRYLITLGSHDPRVKQALSKSLF